MKHFGERIRELRKERGITSYEMATKLGISRNTLTNWERGEKEPHTLEIFEEMAKILNVSLKSLLEGKSEDELENNPVIKNLTERVARLERVLEQFLS